MGLRLVWCAALAGAFAGCGGDPKAGGSADLPPSEVAVAIRPGAVTLLPLQTQRFTADVSNVADRSVDWSIAEGAAGGSINAMGLYVAPANGGPFHVVATSRADRKAFATAVVMVTSLPSQISISILPSQATLEVNRTQRFSAVVSGTADSAVTWSEAEGSGGGTVDGNGVYTAPNAAGTYHVTATSHADPSKSATAELTVIATPLAVSITIAPDQVQLAYAATARFVATVKNAADTSVTWSVAEGSAGGNVNAQGLYTAPATGGTYHVVATANADPTKTATASVVVNAPPPEVRISISPDGAEASTGGSLSFSATVTGSTDTAVSWSVAESNGGTVDANGNYKAPAAAGDYHVVATAHADPTKSASAQVTVSSPPPPPAIGGASIMPESVIVTAGRTYQFAVAAPRASGAVDVAVAEGAAGGTIDSSLLYAAPSTPGTYHVVATARDGSSARATVIVRSAGSSVSPSSVSVAPGGIVQFTTSRPADETIMWWTQDPGSLTVDTGFYQAPEKPGTYHVSAYDFEGFLIGTAEVTVRADPVYVTINLPHLTGLHPGDGAAYRATVHGTPDQRVTWSVVERDGGTMDANGNYTSPSGRTGVYHIVATSVAAPSATAMSVYETCNGGTGVVTCRIRMYDAGGTVLPASVTYAIFWGPSYGFAPEVPPAMEDLLRGLDGSAYLAIADQYMRGAKTATRFGGILRDTTTPPLQFDVGAEICRILDANGMEPRADGIYFLYTSTPRKDPGNYCAWHSYATCHGVPIAMAYMPYPDGLCHIDMNLCGANPDVNSLASSTAHEFMETITDTGFPRGAWRSINDGEIGDVCAWSDSCIPLATGAFQIQAEFSNAAGACVFR